MLEQRPGFADPHLNSLLPEVTFNRRGFLASGASVGFALSAGPLAAQTVVRTPADGLDTADIKIPVTGGDMPGYMAAPAKAGKRPTIIVIPEIFGMHEYQKDICRRLARLGYAAITADPFFRFGDLSKLTEVREVAAQASKLDDTQMLADLDGVVAFLEKQPKVNASKLGITGMCRGGRSVWMYAAHSAKIKAAVSWYGGLNPVPPAMPRTPIDVAPNLKAPVLGLYAGADGGIPVAAVARMQEALKTGNSNSLASRFILYPNMPHAFHADYRPSFRKEAAEDGWQQMLAWFKEKGVA
jgi:carboxymethylenebutenolidase